MNRIYLASSWRNAEQPKVLAALRAAGHEVYDFRNPAPGNEGFHWSEVDGGWQSWSLSRYIDSLKHPIAQYGFQLDKAALDWCDACVLLLPCGPSAHLEAGYATGRGKRVIVLLREDKFEPELMYLLCAGCVTSIPDLLTALALPAPRFDIVREPDQEAAE
jgi:hypothetical protein